MGILGTLEKRKEETELAIARAEEADVHMTTGKSSIASAKSSMYVAESIQELGNTIVQSTEKMIESNKNLSKSNSKYANALNWLTAALVLIGLIGLLKK